MCILCVIQKWSRQVATMLPWLVIPLIGLWALSQLLPPAYRFEITSARLACVFVLLVTLFWYEILMPQLSAWRTCRNARLREKKRFEAIALQKLRKTATRRCRNCLTPYRDQNPGGGKFMCSYCGHISKRPVLDLPVLPGLGMSNSGIIKDLAGRGGKILNGKAWPDNGWMYSQDWSENGSWSGGSTSGKSNYWQKNRGGYFGGDENCLAEKSYSGGLVFVCKLLTSFFVSFKWLWRKICRISSSEDASSDAEHRAILAKRGHNGANFHESRADKARRKAEEKRQARLEKELLEEEERKQREEVARLVEERRKLRDEIMEVEKDHNRLSTHIREKDSKKEAEKRRQERTKGKDKDKGSSKSNSDVEELEKKAGKESDRRQEFDKTTENEHVEHQKSGAESLKGQISDSGHGAKSTSSFGRGNSGTRYFDRMRGTFLSPSKAFSGSVFFRKTANSPATVIKENKLGSTADHVQRDICPPELQAGKSSLNGDDKNINHPVVSESQSRTAPKKSWQQLFTRSSSAPTSNTNVISRPSPKPQAEVQNPQLPAQSSPIALFDNPISFGLPSPFMVPAYTNASSFSSLGFSQPVEPIFPCAVEGTHDFMPEEPERFEDPCFTADEMSLLGPVSELFATDVEKPNSIKNLSASHEISKPSPIESPISRLRVVDEKHNGSTWFPTSPSAQDFRALPVDDVHVNEKGTWQMWNSSIVQEALGLVGGPGSWLLAPEQNRTMKEDNMQPPHQKTMASLFVTNDQVISAPHSPHKVLHGNVDNGGAFSTVTSPNDKKWAYNTFYPPLSGGHNHFSPISQEENSQNEMVFRSPDAAATNHHFEPPPANCWSNEEWTTQGSGDGTGKSAPRPGIGGLFPARDAQSLW